MTKNNATTDLEDKNEKGAELVTQSGPAPVSAPLVADTALLNDFIQEARDQLLQVELNLLTLKDDGQNSQATKAAFRAMHSIKSAASFLYLKDINLCATEAEALLDYMHKGDMQVTPVSLELLFQVVDVLRTLLSNVETAVATDRMLQSWPKVPLLVEACRQAFIDQLLGSDEVQENSGNIEATAEVDAKGTLNDELRQSILEVEKTATVIVEELQGIVSQAPGAEALARSLAEAVGGMCSTMRRVDHQKLAALDADLEPYARDLSTQEGKDVSLMLIWSGWRVSRAALEPLAEVLRLLIRHAIRHSVEASEQRQKAGKEGTATMLVMPTCSSQGLSIDLSVDGCGEDPRASEKCKCFQKARELLREVGGDLEVNATPGERTTFTIPLPSRFEFSS